MKLHACCERRLTCHSDDMILYTTVHYVTYLLIIIAFLGFACVSGPIFFRHHQPAKNIQYCPLLFFFSFCHFVKADTLDELVVYYYLLFSKSVTFYHHSHFSNSGLANILTAWQTCAFYSKCITKGSTYTDRLLLLLAVCKRVAGLHTFIMSPKRK